MFYQESESFEEKILEFNNEIRYIDHDISVRANKLRFNSKNNFVFSYSFIDSTDISINDCKKWNNQREVLANLTIENITKKYPDDNTSDIFTIKFRPNYKKSSTRYIIIIAQNEGSNSLENFKNPCYLTKLATEKTEGTKNINMVDIGENDLIEANIDIYDILGKTDKYIINIISQEIRFEKKINYYEPEIFIHREYYEKEVDEEEEDFDDEDDDDEEEEEYYEEKEEEEKYNEEEYEEEQEEVKEEEEHEEEKKEEEHEDENKEEEDDKNDEDDDGFPLVYSILIGVTSFILIVVAIFLIIRYIRKRKGNIDLKRETKNLENEQLMQDL